MIPTLIRAYEASVTIAPYKIVMFSDTAASAKIAAASANTSPVLGVSGGQGGVAGDMVDVIHAGIGLVTLGATVLAGAELTSDASGNAITAVPTAAVFMTVIGKALFPGVSGDIIEVLVGPRAFYRGT